MMGNAKARLVDAGVWKTISQRALEASRPRYFHWSASANTDPETAAARHASEFWRQCTVSSFGTLSSQSHSLIQFSKSPSKSFIVALRFNYYNTFSPFYSLLSVGEPEGPIIRYRLYLKELIFYFFVISMTEVLRLQHKVTKV